MNFNCVCYYNMNCKFSNCFFQLKTIKIKCKKYYDFNKNFDGAYKIEDFNLKPSEFQYN